MKTTRLLAFTLIELLVYSFIVSFIVGAFLTASYYLITSSQRDREREAVAEVARYVERKLDIAILGATAAQITPSSGTSAYLQVQKSCTDLVRIDLASNALRQSKDSNSDCQITGTDAATGLTNSHVQVSGVSFERQTQNDQPVIRARATLQGRYMTYTLDKTLYLK